MVALRGLSLLLFSLGLLIGMIINKYYGVIHMSKTPSGAHEIRVVAECSPQKITKKKTTTNFGLKASEYCGMYLILETEAVSYHKDQSVPNCKGRGFNFQKRQCVLQAQC